MDKEETESPAKPRKSWNASGPLQMKKNSSVNTDEKVKFENLQGNEAPWLSIPLQDAPTKRKSSINIKVFPEEELMADDEQNIEGENIGDLSEPDLEIFEKPVDFQRSSSRRPIIKLTETDEDDTIFDNDLIKTSKNIEHLFDIKEEEEDENRADNKLQEEVENEDMKIIKRGSTSNGMNISGDEAEPNENQDNDDDDDPRELELKGADTLRGDDTDLERHVTVEEEKNIDLMINLISNDKIGETNLRNDPRFSHIKFLIFPDDFLKAYWEIALALAMSYTILVTPFRIAFIEEEDTFFWTFLNYTTDITFALDIPLNFLSAYFDNHDNLVTSLRKIASNYLSGWFMFDFIGVFPFDQTMQVDRYGSLVRLSKLPRLYKLVKMTKFLRILKIIKERSKFLSYLTEFLKVGPGFERLFASLISIFIFCHVAACFWFMAADLNYEDATNWVMRFGHIDDEIFDKYITAYYWVTQTVVTVGYGDISCGNTVERVISCALMFIGVFFYSFTIGSLSSLLSSLDSKNAYIDQKLNVLAQIKNQYGINNLLYNRVKRALKYGHLKTNEEKVKFLNELPMNLRIECSVIMYRDTVSGIEFFRNKPARFIAFIGPYLKVLKIGKDEYVFTEGEYADEMYFIKSGQVSMVLKEYNNFQFITIAQGYYFGEVDLLFGETRKHTYMADEDCVLLSFSKKEFTRIFFHEFRDIGSELYKNALKRRLRANKVATEAMEYCEREMKEREKKQNEEVTKSKRYAFKTQISIAGDHSSSLTKNDLEEAVKNEHASSVLPTIMPRFQLVSQTNIPGNEEEKHEEEDSSPPESQNNQTQKTKGGNNQKKESKTVNKLKNAVAVSKLFGHKHNNSAPLGGNVVEPTNIEKDASFKHLDDMQGRLKKMEDNVEQIFSFFKDLGLESHGQSFFERNSLRARRASKRGMSMNKLGGFTVEEPEQEKKEQLPSNGVSLGASPINHAFMKGLPEDITDSTKLSESLKILPNAQAQKHVNKRGGSLRNLGIFNFFTKSGDQKDLK